MARRGQHPPYCGNWSSDVCSSDVSVTVTVPDVAPLPLLFTVIVYVAPACPCVKFPVCDFVMLRSASCVTVVASLAVSFEVLVSPPPDTATVFVIEAAARSEERRVG